MPQPQSGISKRSLLLLGGLTALLASPSARARLASLAQDTLGTAQNLLDETLAPAAQHAAHSVAAHAGELTEEAKKVVIQAQEHLPGLLAEVRDQAGERGKQLLSSAAELSADWRGDLAERAAEAAAAAAKTASSVQESVQERVSDAAQQVQQRRQALPSSAAEVPGDVGKKAAQLQKEGKHLAHKKLAQVHKDARKTVQKRGKKAVKQVRKSWAVFADDAHDQVQAKAADARQAALAQLKSASKGSRKQIKGYEKKIARLEKELGRTASKQLKKMGVGKQRRSAGGLLPVLLLIGGGVVLARVPAARQGILSAVGAVSPDAAQWLHDAGRSVRNIVGTAWLERMEDANHAPAPAAPSPKPQQASGSAAGASVEANAPAAVPASPEKADKVDKASADQAEAPKTETPKTT